MHLACLCRENDFVLGCGKKQQPGVLMDIFLQFRFCYHYKTFFSFGPLIYACSGFGLCGYACYCVCISGSMWVLGCRNFSPSRSLCTFDALGLCDSCDDMSLWFRESSVHYNLLCHRLIVTPLRVLSTYKPLGRLKF
ncbi:unnamed protein product [Lupinus luteus]|uniref:Uncharacterized protein n=1 Tax=Lupinus luteus TaxID=3873 RepID=A0AAV1YF87_LUPLU